MVDWAFSMAYVICNTDSVNSDGKKLDSKNDRFWYRAVHKRRRQFEAPRDMPKADDRLTSAPRGVRDPK